MRNRKKILVALVLSLCMMLSIGGMASVSASSGSGSGSGSSGWSYGSGSSDGSSSASKYKYWDTGSGSSDGSSSATKKSDGTSGATTTESPTVTETPTPTATATPTVSPSEEPSVTESPVVSEDPAESPEPSEDPAETVHALTKTLTMARRGVTAPSGTFTFQFKAVTDGAPAIADKTVSYDSDTDYSKGVATFETDDLFDGVVWPSSGIYEYEVSEKQSGLGESDNGTMIYDDAVYTLMVQVGTDLKISAIAVKDSEGNKQANGLVFENRYVKENTNGSEEDPDGEKVNLTVSKRFEGSDLTGSEEAEFSVTFYADKANMDEKNYLIAPTVGAVPEGCGLTEGAQLNFSTSYTFKLKTGESVVIYAPAGTVYNLEEVTEGYTTTATFKCDGETINGVAGASINGCYLGDSGENSAVFVNSTTKTPVETGRDGRIAPFLILALIGLLPAAGYVISVRRRSGRNG